MSAGLPTGPRPTAPVAAWLTALVVLITAMTVLIQAPPEPPADWPGTIPQEMTR